ncbi:MAG: hypothetical protein O2960_19140 [Verrucomicrobia bacterium]|nr:hypothetical protein [Verrucomicrobiota bacterium]
MSPLHHFGDFVRELLLRIPLSAARVIFVLLMVLLLIWVLTLPRKDVVAPDSLGRASENLRLWAALALIVQVAVYALL